MIIDLLKSVCTKLEQLQIPYMVSGSVAMSFYTLGRNTQDIDIVLELEESNLEQFLATFDHHYYHQPSIVVEIKRKGMFNIIDFETGLKVDFILRKPNEYAKVAFSRRQIRSSFGFPVSVVSIEDLILAKLLWIQQIVSDRQKNDIRTLLLNPSIDKEYVEQWASNMNIKTFDLI